MTVTHYKHRISLLLLMYTRDRVDLSTLLNLSEDISYYFGDLMNALESINSKLVPQDRAIHLSKKAKFCDDVLGYPNNISDDYEE